MLDAGFSSTLEIRQSWAIKINNLTDKIYLGICLKSMVIRNRFNSKKLDLHSRFDYLYLINN